MLHSLTQRSLAAVATAQLCMAHIAHCREISTQICLLCLPSISFAALQTVKGLIKFRVCVFANLTWVHSQWNQNFIRTRVCSRINHYLSHLQTLQWLACIVSVCKVFYSNWFSIINVVSSGFLVTRIYCLTPFGMDTFSSCSCLYCCYVEGPGSAREMLHQASATGCLVKKRWYLL